MNHTELPIPPEAAALATTSNHEASVVLRAFESFAVTNADQINQAAQLLREVKDKFNGLDQKRKSITRPLRTAIERTNDLFRPALRDLRMASEILRDKISNAEAARLKANREAKLDARIAAAGGEGHGTVSEALARQVPAAETQAPGLAFRYSWEWILSNAHDVPREFLSVDVSLIKAHIKRFNKSETIEHIPGIQFTRKVTPVVQSR